MKKISQLFKKDKILNTGKNEYISGLSNNSKDIKHGYVFFAIKGR